HHRGHAERERGEGARRGRGGEDGDVAARWHLRPELDRPVERDEVRLELVREQAARSHGAGEENATRRPRQLGEKTFLRRDRRDEVDAEPRVEQRVGGSGPDRGGPSGPAARAVGELSRRVGARDEQPVIDFELDAIRPTGSTRPSGQMTTSCPSSRTREASGSSCPAARVTITRTRAPSAARRQEARRDQPPLVSGGPRAPAWARCYRRTCAVSVTRAAETVPIHPQAPGPPQYARAAWIA